MTFASSAVPPGFGPILRSSPVLDALGGFMSRGEGKELEIGLLVGPTHLNARGRLHGGVTATLLDVAMGYMLSARAEENGRKTVAYGRLMSGERLVAEVSVLFVDASVDNT